MHIAIIHDFAGVMLCTGHPSSEHDSAAEFFEDVHADHPMRTADDEAAREAMELNQKSAEKSRNEID